MGEAADMILDGILDWNGEYTSDGYSYSRPKRKMQYSGSGNALHAIRIYFRRYVSKPDAVMSNRDILRILKSYAESIGHPLLGPSQSKHDWQEEFAKVIQADFKAFKKYVSIHTTRVSNPC